MTTNQPAAVALACVAALVLGPGGASSSRADQQGYESRVGVFVECLSIRNSALAPGTPVTIIGLDAEEESTVAGDRIDRRIAARIVDKTDSAEDCPLLIKEQGRRDDAADFTLYTVAPETGGAIISVESGIAIIGLDRQDTNPIDLDGYGVADTFSVDSSFGSLEFYIWSGVPFLGTPLWFGYYEFGLSPEGEYFAARIGVFFYNCLSIRNTALEPGTPVTVIRFNSQEDDNVVTGDTRDRRFAGKIIGKTDSADDCPLQIQERSVRDDAGDFTIYLVAPETGGALNSVEGGIAILGLDPNDSKPIDLDGNGLTDTFQEFSSHGSLVFWVWRGAAPEVGEPFEPLWTGYHVFGHGPEGEDAE